MVAGRRVTSALAVLALLLAVADWIASYYMARTCGSGPEYGVVFLASPVLGAACVAFTVSVRRRPGLFLLLLILAVILFAFIEFEFAVSGEYAGVCGNL